MRYRLSIPLALCLALCFLPPAVPAASDVAITAVRAWTNSCATPLHIEGLPNAFKVTDTLYRGAQPTAAGFKELRKLGIRTVVNLRAFHKDGDGRDDIGLPVERIPINTWNAGEQDVLRFLKIVADTNKTPVFVHCQHGADRTGTMVAVFRMVVCGWKKEDAIDEMVNGGFGFHKTWDNLVALIKGLDVEAIRKKAGLAKREQEGDTP